MIVESREQKLMKSVLNKIEDDFNKTGETVYFEVSDCFIEEHDVQFLISNAKVVRVLGSVDELSIRTIVDTIYHEI
ncbi:hypothetical protein IGX37_01005 [Staphylococcus aureus]|uniref:Uncharacterized protein n=1 Tax=Staphylococcus aureus TaxID=1280 RepID=A0A0N9EJP3_STAAU|nr:hypothetical protein [Staphylococcus aureus]ALF44668.1 hypothetical protein [Staphylococcus aureus]AXS25615.1 hypothetical protein D1G35_14725 [Staphylococcus aureus]AXS25807.1 hypothetical protein D1O27_00315 [Staphylococcus aureus]MBW9604180.1 hypothetical protein [Staphylococcus aureus]MCR0628557.1 hypothetical protein [Staphylococcus aureus]